MPLCDIAPERVFSFSCLGQQWRLRCRNDRAVVTATEELCATAQIVLAELAADDPVLLNSVIDVEVELADTAASPADLVQPLPGNERARWKVAFPPLAHGRSDGADLELLGILVIIAPQLAAPWDKFAVALDRAGRIGLMNRIAAVTDHRTAARVSPIPGRHGRVLPGAPLGTPPNSPPAKPLN